MNYNNYQKYISSETMMGPNSVRVLDELFQKHPLKLDADSKILDKAVPRLIQGIPQKGAISGLFANDRPMRSYFFALSPVRWKAAGCKI